MANTQEILQEQELQHLEEMFGTLLRAYVGLNASIFAYKVTKQFVQSIIKKHKAKSGGEYKVYSFSFDDGDREEIKKVIDAIQAMTKFWKTTSEVIDSIMKVTPSKTGIYITIVNILILDYNRRQYEKAVDRFSKAGLNLRDAEVDSGRIINTKSTDLGDDIDKLTDRSGMNVDYKDITNDYNESVEINEGLVQLLWPVVKTAAVIYAGKVLFDKVLDIKDRMQVDYGKYITYGWEFEPSEVSISKVQKLFDEVALQIEYFDRQDVIKDVAVEVFRNKDKIVSYLMISVEGTGKIREAQRVLEKVTRKYDIQFTEIKRGNI